MLRIIFQNDWWTPVKVNIQFEVNKVEIQFKVNKVKIQFPDMFNTVILLVLARFYRLYPPLRTFDYTFRISKCPRLGDC